MSRRYPLRKLKSLWISWTVLLVLGPAVSAAGPYLDHVACPVNKRCQEKPPKWKIQRVCPKPVCDPCTLEHHGYYHTCWRPSSVPPDWSHCPVPPPAVVFSASQAPVPVQLPGAVLAPQAQPSGPTPSPRRLPDSKPLPRAPVAPPAKDTPPSTPPKPKKPKLSVTPPPDTLLTPARAPAGFLPEFK